MTEAVRATFRDQAASCEALGSPFTARLLRGLADGLCAGTPVADRVLGWVGDASSRGDALALRLAGGLHAIARRPGATLASVYPPNTAAETPALIAAALAAMTEHADFLLAWLGQPPQTNEVRRSAPLIAAGHWLTQRLGLPLVLSELGASAGLNLLWDNHRLQIGPVAYGPPEGVLLQPHWHGAPPPLCPPRIIERAGVDLQPVDPQADRARLLAYIWPDQPDRMHRTEVALDLAARMRPHIDAADAIDWLQQRLRTRYQGALHLIFHTVAWQYFPTDAQARGRALLAAAGGAASDDAPLAHLAMEADAEVNGAALTLTLWPGGPTGEVIRLGRVDFHGRWVDWQAPA